MIDCPPLEEEDRGDAHGLRLATFGVTVIAVEVRAVVRSG